MKKLFAMLTILAFVTMTTPTLAVDYSNVTSDAKIRSAMNLLKTANGQATVSAIVDNNIKVMFFDLGTISARYVDAHAMATKDDSGQNYILINTKHRHAPPEAIACLLAHEATHRLSKTTIDEEIQAWTNEARQWTNFKALNPAMNYKGELVDRLNRLEVMYSNNNSSTIAMAVRTNTNYANLKK